MEKIRYEPDGAPIIGANVRARVDLTPTFIHMHITDSDDADKLLGVVTVVYSGDPGALEKVVASLVNLHANIQRPKVAANG